nr:MAG TPA: hypothetical protein [Caudoviricetes sp.]
MIIIIAPVLNGFYELFTIHVSTCCVVMKFFISAAFRFCGYCNSLVNNNSPD